MVSDSRDEAAASVFLVLAVEIKESIVRTSQHLNYTPKEWSEETEGWIGSTLRMSGHSSGTDANRLESAECGLPTPKQVPEAVGYHFTVIRLFRQSATIVNTAPIRQT